MSSLPPDILRSFERGKRMREGILAFPVQQVSFQKFFNALMGMKHGDLNSFISRAIFAREKSSSIDFSSSSRSFLILLKHLLLWPSSKRIPADLYIFRNFLYLLFIISAVISFVSSHEMSA